MQPVGLLFIFVPHAVYLASLLPWMLACECMAAFSVKRSESAAEKKGSGSCTHLNLKLRPHFFLNPTDLITVFGFQPKVGVA